MEIWKPIKGYELSYQVSNLGRVKRLSVSQNMDWIKENTKRKLPERVLKSCKKDGKYHVVTLCKNNKLKQKYVHRLVAESFIGDIPKDLVVNHVDGNINNNELSNLEIITRRDNTYHGLKNKKQSSKYTGVHWNKSRKKWIAMTRVNGSSKIYLGGFENELDAYKAVLNKLKEHGLKSKYV